MAEDNEGKLYIGTDNGLYSLLIFSDVLEHILYTTLGDAAYHPLDIRWACFVDKWQNVWIGTLNGLSRLIPIPITEICRFDKLTISGEGNCLHAMLQTNNGEWWMGGTKRSDSFHPNAEGDIGMWYGTSRTALLSRSPHNRVRKIYGYDDGDLWVCTDHGINCYDQRSLIR